MLEHLFRECKYDFTMGAPFHCAWDASVSLWSNHDIEWHYDICPDFDKIVQYLEKELMTWTCKNPD